MISTFCGSRGSRGYRSAVEQHARARQDRAATIEAADLEARSIAAASREAAGAAGAASSADAATRAPAIIPWLAAECACTSPEHTCPARTPPLPRELLPHLYVSLSDAAEVAHRAYAACDTSAACPYTPEVKIRISTDPYDFDPDEGYAAAMAACDARSASALVSCQHALGWKFTQVPHHVSSNHMCTYWSRETSPTPLGHMQPSAWRRFGADGKPASFVIRQCAEQYLFTRTEWKTAEKAAEACALSAVRSLKRLPYSMRDFGEEHSNFSRNYQNALAEALGVTIGNLIDYEGHSCPLDVVFSCRLSYARLMHDRKVNEGRPDTRGRELLELLTEIACTRPTHACLEGGTTYALDRFTPEELALVQSEMGIHEARPADPRTDEHPAAKYLADQNLARLVELRDMIRIDTDLRYARDFRRSGMEALIESRGDSIIRKYASSALRIPAGGKPVANIIGQFLSRCINKKTPVLSRAAIRGAATRAATSMPTATPALAAVPLKIYRPRRGGADIELVYRVKGFAIPALLFMTPSHPHFRMIITNRTEIKLQGKADHTYGPAKDSCPMKWSRQWIAYARAEMLASVQLEMKSDPTVTSAMRGAVLRSLKRSVVSWRLQAEARQQYQDRSYYDSGHTARTSMIAYWRHREELQSYTTISSAEETDAAAAEPAALVTAELAAAAQRAWAAASPRDLSGVACSPSASRQIDERPAPSASISDLADRRAFIDLTLDSDADDDNATAAAAAAIAHRHEEHAIDMSPPPAAALGTQHSLSAFASAAAGAPSSIGVASVNKRDNSSEGSDSPSKRQRIDQWHP
jgi:hypothetical protein